LNLAAGLSSKFDIVVASPSDGPLRHHFLARQIQAIVVPHLDDDIHVSRSLLLAFDGLLANTLASFMCIHAAYQLRKPSAWYIHEGQAAALFVKLFGPQLLAAFPLATRVVVPCEFSRNFYATVRAGIEIVPYGVEYRETKSQSIRNQPMKFLQLGTIEPRKGQDITCAAFRLLKDQPIDINIVGRIGSSDYQTQLLAYCADIPHIRFFPEVDASQTAELIGQCDALVVSSRDEVTPMVILEAMAARKPVIASAVGGIPEMMVDGQSGFLYPPQNAQQLAGIIMRLVQDDPLCQAVGTAAQQFVRANRTLDLYRDKFVQILQAFPSSACIVQAPAKP